MLPFLMRALRSCIETPGGRWFAAYLLWSAGLTLRRGFTQVGLPFILAGLFLILWRPFKTSDEATDLLPPRFLVFLGLPCLGLVALVRTPYFLRGGAYAPAIFFLTALTLVAALGALYFRPRPRLTVAVFLAVLYAASGILTIRQIPAPAHDAFVFQQNGARLLLKGKNPYEGRFPNIYSRQDSLLYFGEYLPYIDYYLYPPLSLASTTAGVAAAGDVRYSLLAAQTGGGLLLWGAAVAAGAASWPATALTAAYYLFPLNLFILEQACTEPLIVFALALFIFLLIKNKNAWLAPALAVFLGMKQYGAVAVPLLALHPWIEKRRLTVLTGAMALAGLTLLPFYLWSPPDFINDVVRQVVRTPIRGDQMCLPGIFYHFWGLRIPGWLGFPAALVAAAVFARKGRPGAAGLTAGLWATYTLFFFFSKQAGPNYYYFASHAALIALAAAPHRILSPKSAPSTS